MKPRLLRLRYFLWVVVPMLAYAGYVHFGAPHIIWSYSWIDRGQAYADWSARHYTRCTFIGPFGEFDQVPINGRCSWITFIQPPQGG